MPNSILNDTNIPSINLYLKSEDAIESINDTHKVFSLSKQVSVSRPDIQTLIALTGFEMPYSFYLINSNNNVLEIISSATTYTITIPVGNYNVFSLMNEINNNTTFVGGLFDLVFDTANNKYTISQQQGNQLQITSNTTIHKIMGFTTAQFGINQTSILGNNCVDFSGIKTLNIQLMNIGVSNLDSQGKITPIIHKISVEALPNEFIHFEEEAEHIFSVVDTEIINSFEVKITDENNNTLEMNGGNFSLVLTIHQNYKRPDRRISDYYLFEKNIEEKEE